MAATVVYRSLDPSEAPIAFRKLLLCRMSRITIMSVRRMLSEREIDMYEMLKLPQVVVSASGPDAW